MDCNAIENAVREMAAELIEDAVEDNYGIYWLTYTRDKTGSLLSEIDESIFGGTGGVIFFFLSAYEYFGETEYRVVAEKATRWVFHHSENTVPRYISLYSGRSGLIYLGCRAYQLTGNPDYLDMARKVLYGIREVLEEGNAIHDLVSGEAGNLLAVTSFFALTGDPVCLPLIRKGLERLIDHSLLAPKGVKWGYAYNALDSLSGLSHGASGVAFTLLEIGHFFKNKALLQLAEQALAYEARYYKKEIGNWIDLRVYTEYLDDPTLPDKAKEDFLVQAGNSNSWAHGATGIGLVRIRAFEIFQKRKFRTESFRATNKTLSDWARLSNPVDFNLCGGTGAWAVLLRYAGDVFKSTELTVRALEIMITAVSVRNRLGYYPAVWQEGLEGADLMYGKSGVGMAMLYVLKPGMFPPPWLPGLPVRSETLCPEVSCLADLTVGKLRSRIVGKHFVRTIELLRLLFPGNTFSFFSDDHYKGRGAEWRQLRKLIRQKLLEVPARQQVVVREIFFLESARTEWLVRSAPYVYTTLREMELRRKSERQDIKERTLFLAKAFRISTHIRIKSLRWSWTGDSGQAWFENLGKPPGHFPVMLVHSGTRVDEYPLSNWGYTLLSAMKKEVSGVALVKILASVLTGDRVYGKEELEALVASQLEQYMSEGIVRPVSEVTR